MMLVLNDAAGARFLRALDRGDGNGKLLWGVVGRPRYRMVSGTLKEGTDFVVVGAQKSGTTSFWATVRRDA